MPVALLPPDIYVILSALDDSRGITLKPVGLDLDNLTRVAVKGVESIEQTKWRIVPQGGDLYEITLSGEPIQFIVKDNLLYATPYEDGIHLRIEPTGDETWRFHVPNKNKVLRLDAEGTQVKAAPADNTTHELWYVEPWPIIRD